MVKYDIAKILTVSTIHITQETRKLLDIEPSQNNLGLTVYNKSDYGWFIYIAEYAIVNKPEDLKVCIDLAKQNGCEWLCLDCDGPEYEELPKYKW